MGRIDWNIVIQEQNNITRGKSSDGLKNAEMAEAISKWSHPSCVPACTGCLSIQGLAKFTSIIF